MQEISRLMGLFNGITVQEYARRHKEDHLLYPQAKIEYIIETERGCISPGAIYKWPKASKGKVHVTGFGIIELSGQYWFLASFYSKRQDKPRIEKLYPEEVLKMLEWGEVEYLGNIFNPEFRKAYDYQRLSLAVIGFVSLVYNNKMNKNVTVDHIIDKLERGEMTMDDLLDKCKMTTGESLLI